MANPKWTNLTCESAFRPVPKMLVNVTCRTDCNATDIHTQTDGINRSAVI